MTQNPNDDLAAKIAALKAELEAEAAGAQTATMPSAPAPMPYSAPGSNGHAPDSANAKTFRLAVATDWSSAAAPMAVLRAYATFFKPDAPVELVFAVPHEPSQVDLDAVKVLFEGLQGVENTAPLQIESFAEVSSKSCYAAIIPTGDMDALIMELSVFFTQMHHLALTVSDPEKLRDEPAPQNGHNAGLSRRLGLFR